MPALLGLDFVDARRGWAAGLGGLVMGTTNGGSSWKALPHTSVEYVFGLRFLDAKHGWVVGQNANSYGTIIATTNGGQT